MIKKKQQIRIHPRNSTYETRLHNAIFGRFHDMHPGTSSKHEKDKRRTGKEEEEEEETQTHTQTKEQQENI